MKAFAGTTVIELVVGTAILAIIFLMATQIMGSMGTGISVEQTSAEQQTRTTAAVYDVMSELSSYSTLSPIQPATELHISPAGDRITFRIPTGIDNAGAVTWGEQITYCRELNEREIQNNGIDDDGNGLTDNNDGVLVRRVEDASTGDVLSKTVVTTQVPFGGFLVEQLRYDTAPTPHYSPDPAGRILRVTIQRAAITHTGAPDGTLFTSTVSRMYYLRNIQQ